MEFCSWCKLLGCLPGGTGSWQVLLTLKVGCLSFYGFNVSMLPTCFFHVNCNKLKVHSLMLDVGFFFFPHFSGEGRRSSKPNLFISLISPAVLHMVKDCLHCFSVEETFSLPSPVQYKFRGRKISVEGRHTSRL